MPLISYANLTAKSFADPNATFAQRAISRMTNTAAPMPPGAAPVVPAADVATVMSWVSTQYPMATTIVHARPGAGGTTGGGVGGASGGGVGGAGGSTTTVANGIPCDVATLLQNRCVGCHSNPPINGAPMPLVTYANLTAPSIAERGADVRAARADAHAGQPVPDAAAAERGRDRRRDDGDEQLDQREVSDGYLHADDDGRWGRHRRGWGGAGGATGAGGAGGGTAAGLPCDVQAVFTTHCTTCHATDAGAAARRCRWSRGPTWSRRRSRTRRRRSRSARSCACRATRARCRRRPARRRRRRRSPR